MTACTYVWRKEQNLKYRDINIEYFLKIQSKRFQQVFIASKFSFRLLSTSCSWGVFTLAFFLRALNRVNCPVSSASNFHHSIINDWMYISPSLIWLANKGSIRQLLHNYSVNICHLEQKCMVDNCKGWYMR